MSVTWTADQKKVIDTRGCNLLVSAAAGSGKTAVLVERILALVTDPHAGVDVDRLLITTFTKAAAGEMRERIGKALSEKLKEDPENEWLQRQEALVSRAHITTIHGFCLYVIRNYFHTIDLNPNFRIADEGEIQLLKQDVVKEALEEAYAAGDDDFFRFAESYGRGSRGTGLEEMILQLYEYAIASPQPVRWLKQCAAMYELKSDASWDAFIGCEAMFRELKTVVKDCVEELRQALAVARMPDGPLPYEDVLRSDEAQLQELMNSDTIEAFEEILSGIRFKALPRRNMKIMAGADETLCQQAMDLRNQVKEALKGLTKQYFQLPKELLFEQMQKTAGNVEVYVRLTLRFMECLEEKKRKKNILDFSDQEHLALRILTREEDGRLTPSQVADTFADYFAEVMVDEYQDSNLVQEAILDSISGSRKGKDNRFMVGDVKQSIYRFRQAEPGLFLDKYGRYADGQEGVRIDLHQNFRSRSEVLTPVNEVFRHIMCRELGGIEYDDAAALYEGASYPDAKDCRAEILLLSQEEWEELRQESRWTKQETEAHLAADRIHTLLGEGTVTENGKLRPVRPGDIVILLRTMSGWSETFVRVLQEEGIPASAQSREGYFQTVEIETILSYLRLLDNPTQEIPLAAAMHGMLGGFSSEEMARIKAAFPEDNYVNACRKYMEEGTDADLGERLKSFFAQTADYRKRATWTSIHELLWQILTETGYLYRVRALPGGEQRLANVEMLLKKAQDYEKISYHGLFHFVRYIEKMQKYQMDFGEASIAGENGEAVRIMSIHHSKGLEFPVVIAAGLGKSFNRQESREPVVLHNRYGIGMDYVDLETRMRRPVLLKQLIRRQNLLDNLAEELRILYVAMTRAKEKLILTGMAGEDFMEEPGMDEGREKLLFSRLAGASCDLAWILPARNRQGSSLEKRSVSVGKLLERAVKSRIKTALSREELERTLLFGRREEDSCREVAKRLSWEYPWKTEKQPKQKYSVTELKKLQMAEESDAGKELYPESDVIPLIPQFIEKTEEKTGAARGTVYHTVMEFLNFGEATDVQEIREALARMVQEGRLQEEEVKAVRPEDFAVFAGTELARRMERARDRGELFREQPFVIGLPGTEVDGSDSEELVLIQGIIDAFFYEDDGIVVVDYKTDRVRFAAELTDKYHAQLEYYEKALTMMTGRRVKEKLIYSFTLGEVIKV